jgi:hypothetical protein
MKGPYLKRYNYASGLAVCPVIASEAVTAQVPLGIA